MITQKYNQHKETIHNFFWRALQIMGKQGIIFLIFIICAKLLTPFEFGVYNYVLAIVFFLILFGDFGISTATSKYVAEYNVTDKNKLKAVLFNSGLIILILTILITILTLIFGKYFLGDKYTYVLYLLPLIFLAPMTSLYDGIYRGLKRFKILAIISLIIGIISLSFVYILIKQYGLIGALWAQNIFYLLLLVGLGLGYRDCCFKINREVMKEIGKYSFIIGIGMLGYYFYSRIDILFLGYYGFIEQINYFEIINKILMLFLIPFTIFGQVVSPNITSLYIKKDYTKIRAKFKKYLLLSFIFSLIAVIFIFLFSKILLSSFLTNYYNQAMITIIYLMLIVFFTQFLNGVIPLMVAATGHAKLSTYFLIIFGIVHVILNYTFINSYGFIGIAYSIVITKVLCDLLFIYWYFRILRNIK